MWRARVGRSRVDGLRGSARGDYLPEDELGEVLLALYALADGLDVDPTEAHDGSLAEYARRLEETGDAASGE